MFVVLTTLCLMGLSSSAVADHHQPCHSPNMTGQLSMVDLQNKVFATADFVYDPLAKKLRVKTNPIFGSMHTINSSVDVLLLLNEGVFYEIDGKNRSCEKKVLHSPVSSMEVPADASYLMKTTLGSPSVESEGLTITGWQGSVSETQGSYYSCVTLGCMPVSMVYTTATSIITVSHLQVETEIKDPEQLTVPSFCEGRPLEEEPHGSVNTFFTVLW